MPFAVQKQCARSECEDEDVEIIEDTAYNVRFFRILFFNNRNTSLTVKSQKSSVSTEIIPETVCAYFCDRKL